MVRCLSYAILFPVKVTTCFTSNLLHLYATFPPLPFLKQQQLSDSQADYTIDCSHKENILNIYQLLIQINNPCKEIYAISIQNALDAHEHAHPAISEYRNIICHGIYV